MRPLTNGEWGFWGLKGVGKALNLGVFAAFIFFNKALALPMALMYSLAPEF